MLRFYRIFHRSPIFSISLLSECLSFEQMKLVPKFEKHILHEHPLPRKIRFREAFFLGIYEPPWSTLLIFTCSHVFITDVDVASIVKDKTNSRTQTHVPKYRHRYLRAELQSIATQLCWTFRIPSSSGFEARKSTKNRPMFPRVFCCVSWARARAWPWLPLISSLCRCMLHHVRGWWWHRYFDRISQMSSEVLVYGRCQS